MHTFTRRGQTVRTQHNCDPRWGRIMYIPGDTVLVPDIMLWRSVILMAFLDLSGDDPGERETVKLWFTDGIFQEDFREVCELAHILTEDVLELYHLVLLGKLRVPTWRTIRNIWRQEAEKERAKRTRTNYEET